MFLRWQTLAFFLVPFASGLLLPLGFAPFHYASVSLLSLAVFYYNLQIKSSNRGFVWGLLFGLGYFGLGVSWVFVSVHNYGHLNYGLSSLITLMFVLYLSCFMGLIGYFVKLMKLSPFSLASALLFSALWVLIEWFRGYLFTGFPWLALGFGQVDGPFRGFIPIFGLYGVSFIVSLVAALLVISFKCRLFSKLFLLGFIVSLTLIAHYLEKFAWTNLQKNNPISVAVIQTNLSMRDKWDDQLFWQIINRYQKHVDRALGVNLIVMPESAIPIASNYLKSFIRELDIKANAHNSAILLGIPKEDRNLNYYNGMAGLGKAHGWYLKQHLVPFGEFIPSIFMNLLHWLGIPDVDLKPGPGIQPLIKVHNRSVATIICYELAYPNLLKRQLPAAEFIVSISDDGWFGHSLAVYQHQQMAQALSLQTGRYQILSNNDGLSSVIDAYGTISKTLAFAEIGTLYSVIYPASGSTPWTSLGDWPVLLLSSVIVFYYFFVSIILPNALRLTLAANQKRRYPY